MNLHLLPRQLILSFFLCAIYLIFLVWRRFQILLIQDGKLYGKEFFHDIISRELGVPELTKGKEFQKNEFIVQLGQVRTDNS